MKNLVNTLRTATEELKNRYFESVKGWSAKEYETIIARLYWGPVEWCKFFGIEPRIEESRYKPGKKEIFYPRNFYNTSLSRDLYREQEKARKMGNLTAEQYIAKELERAGKHYEDSLLKLAFRIEKKGLNIEALKVSSGFVGVNFEATITDGEKTVRAFTIIASGPIQRPHYRYLIK